MIRMEDAELEKRFGEEFTAYQQQGPRYTAYDPNSAEGSDSPTG